MEAIKENKFEYSELCMYLIHMEASRSHRRLVFKRPELLEVRARLIKQLPLVNIDLIPTMEIWKLPPVLFEFLKQYNYVTTAIKVEWFYGGIYHYEVNVEYRNRIKMGRQGERQMYSKTFDSLGFNDPEMALRMWMESVDRPGVLIKYEDVAYHQGDNKAVHQVARMISTAIDCEHVITATVLQ